MLAGPLGLLDCHLLPHKMLSNGPSVPIILSITTYSWEWQQRNWPLSCKKVTEDFEKFRGLRNDLLVEVFLCCFGDVSGRGEGGCERLKKWGGKIAVLEKNKFNRWRARRNRWLECLVLKAIVVVWLIDDIIQLRDLSPTAYQAPGQLL